jgi:SulP family sulfate permease
MPELDPSANGEAPRPGAWETLRHYVPALAALRGYGRHALGADALAGLTVATVAVPQAMAYAQVAGIPPQVGLYTAVVVCAVAALFSPSKQLVDGPTNAISIALLSTLAFVADPAQKLSYVVLLALLVGLMQLGLRLLRLGDLTRFISHGVIVGFTVGAGALLFMDQIKNLLGLAPRGTASNHFVTRFWLTLSEGHVHGPTAAIGLGTIALVVALHRLRRRLRRRLRVPVPEFLLAVVVMSVVVWAAGLDGEDGVHVVGAVPRRLPGFRPPEVEAVRVRELALGAFAIAVLGLLEAVAMARTLRPAAGPRLDVNQLCLSEGLANVAGSFFGCMPGSGSLTRSAINRHAGAVSQWSALISAAAVAATVLLLAPLAYYIPRACLAGLLMVTAWRMVDRRQLLYHLRTTRYDAGIVLATAVAAVAISVEFCIVVGVMLSFVLYVPRAARVDFTELTITPERVIRERVRTDPVCDRILIYNLEGELLFATAPGLERNLAAIAERARRGVRVIVLRVKRVRNPDAVCLSLLDQFVRHMQARKTVVLLCGVRPDLARALRASGLERLLAHEQIFYEGPVLISSTLEAVRRAYDLLGTDYCAVCPRRHAPGDGSESWYYMI